MITNKKKKTLRISFESFTLLLLLYCHIHARLVSPCFPSSSSKSELFRQYNFATKLAT